MALPPILPAPNKKKPRKKNIENYWGQRIPNVRGKPSAVEMGVNPYTHKRYAVPYFKSRKKYRRSMS